jgi:hypothetical protein
MSDAKSGESGADRRRHPRHDLKLHVQLSSGERTFALVSENISLGGIFLKTTGEPLPLNEPVQLEVVLPGVNHGRDKRVPISGVVLYQVAGKGAGVEFMWWSDEEQARREELASYLAELGLKGGDVDDALGAGALSEASEIKS